MNCQKVDRRIHTPKNCMRGNHHHFLSWTRFMLSPISTSKQALHYAVTRCAANMKRDVPLEYTTHNASMPTRTASRTDLVSAYSADMRVVFASACWVMWKGAMQRTPWTGHSRRRVPTAGSRYPPTPPCSHTWRRSIGDFSGYHRFQSRDRRMPCMFLAFGACYASSASRQQPAWRPSALCLGVSSTSAHWQQSSAVTQHWGLAMGTCR